MSVTLANGATKNKRRELDFYPTPPDVTHALMQFLLRKKLIGQSVWEPACGDGAMSDVLKQYYSTIISSDIRDSGYGQSGIDFIHSTENVDAIITNPPFALSEAFIAHALPLAPLVAMLVKSQYWHAKKRYELFMKTPPAFILPLTWRPDFMNGERGGAPTMEVQWTVWIRGLRDTRYILLRKPESEVDKRRLQGTQIGMGL